MEAKEGSSSSSSSCSSSSSRSGSPDPSPKSSSVKPSTPPAEVNIEQPTTAPDVVVIKATVPEPSEDDQPSFNVSFIQTQQQSPPPASVEVVSELPKTVPEPNEDDQSSINISLVQKEQQSPPPASEEVVNELPKVDVDQTIPYTENGEDDNEPLLPPTKDEEPPITEEVSVQPHLATSDTDVKDEEKGEVNFELPPSNQQKNGTEKLSGKVSSPPKSESKSPAPSTDERTSLLGSGTSPKKYSSQPTSSSENQGGCCACCVVL